MTARSDAVINAASSVAHAAGEVATTANGILTTYLVKALDKTGNVIDKAVDMVQEQAPLLVHEVLQWYFTYNLIMFIIALTIVLALIIINYKHAKWTLAQGKLPTNDQSDFYNEEGWIMFRFFGTAAQIIPFIIAWNLFNLDWLKIWIAPRLWLIEYTAQLVKSHT